MGHPLLLWAARASALIERQSLGECVYGRGKGLRLTGQSWQSLRNKVLVVGSVLGKEKYIQSEKPIIYLEVFI